MMSAKVKIRVAGPFDGYPVQFGSCQISGGGDHEEIIDGIYMLFRNGNYRNAESARSSAESYLTRQGIELKNIEFS